VNRNLKMPKHKKSKDAKIQDLDFDQLRERYGLKQSLFQ
jgi:hypothetical protein